MSIKTLLCQLVCIGCLLILPAICLAQQNDVSALLKQAEQLEDDDQYDQAEAIYHQIIKDNPGTENALAAQKELACFFIAIHRDADAVAAYQKMLETYESFEALPAAVLQVADTFRNHKRYSEAIEPYQYVLKQWPSNKVALQAQSGIVQVHLFLGEDSSADVAFDRMVSQYGQSSGIAQAVYNVGRCYGGIKRYQKACEVFDSVVQGWPNADIALWSQMASAVAGAGFGSNSIVLDAMQKLQAGSISNVNASKVIGPLGDFCRYLMEIKDQREPGTIRKLLWDFGRQDALKAVDHMGDLYRDTRKYDKAAQLFEYIADTWPGNDQAMESQANIVKMYISIGDEPNSTAYFDKLISKFGQDKEIAAAVENVAQEYLEFGSTHKAYEKFQYILEHWPGGDRAVWAKAGMVMSRIKAMDFEAAESELWELFDKYSNDNDLPAAVHEIVEEYRNCGAYEAGRELFGWILENWQQGDKTMLELQVGIALQSIRLGELDKAEAAAETAVQRYRSKFTSPF